MAKEMPKKKIILLYESGLSDEKIASIFGVCTRTIGNYRKKVGIKTRKRGSWLKGKKRPKHSAFLKQYYKNHPHPLKGKKHSLSTRRKMSESWCYEKIVTKERDKKISLSRIGEKNPNWKGGPKTTKRQKDRIRKSREYIQWRKNVFERDNYTCQICGEKGGRLEAHHKDSFCDFPIFRTVESNGLTLCKPCHMKLHYEQDNKKIC